MLKFILTSVLSFVSTNIDDIFLLMILYTQLPEKERRYKITAGQYLGIGLLVFLSILGAFGTQLLPQKYIGLLGIFPILLGIRTWLQYKNSQKENEPQILTNTGIINVFLITIANGADNLGVYIPVFSGYDATELFLTVLIFAAMTALWCLIGSRLADYPLIKNNLQKYNHIIVPVVLIGLGIFILLDGMLS
ncbi:cadmium resistance transporter [Konateibacter massiliensis]|uniref:cadmium resistance transporter n=1 Tax=Konateibacter massiliensis TaxID=2002841 RepID=UPI000C152A66|nr:cadmium resistance transporter [Konateibacter massiliensis]